MYVELSKVYSRTSFYWPTICKVETTKKNSATWEYTQQSRVWKNYLSAFTVWFGIANSFIYFAEALLADFQVNDIEKIISKDLANAKTRINRINQAEKPEEDSDSHVD